MKRLLLALAVVTAGCSSEEREPLNSPPTASSPEPVRARETTQAAIDEGVAWLLKEQRPGGYWGTGCWSWGYDIYGTVPSAQEAFKVGTTGLCAMALREVGTPEALAAARKAEFWLATEGTKLRRGDGDEIYNVWGHIYALQAIAMARKQDFDLHGPGSGSWTIPEHERLSNLMNGAAIHIDYLNRYQTAYGGWMYYDFKHHTQAPSYPPTSFTTAAGLIAFREARDAGIPVPDIMIKQCQRLVEACRLPNNCYLYSYGHRYRPTSVINRMQGSLARTQSCNDALLAWDSKLVTLDHARAGLADLFEHQRWLECGRKRPQPHEAYYAISGYFYYFGHYYAARLVHRLPEAERGPWKEKMSALIRKHQEPDGCWWDYNALWDFHKPYGTAYAILILNRCR